MVVHPSVTYLFYHILASARARKIVTRVFPERAKKYGGGVPVQGENVLSAAS